jgi:Ca-activated chloride channel family protein
MKFKAVRASLAAVLTATLLIALFPQAYAGSSTGSTLQSTGTASSNARRGKNGEPTPRSADLPDTAAALSSRTETASKTAPPAQPNQQQLAASPENTDQSSEPPQDRASSSNTNSQDDQTRAQSKREAPPFDRPPLRPGQRPGGDSSANSDSSTTSRPRPSYGDRDGASRNDSRGTNRSQSSGSTGAQRDRSSEPSVTGGADPERTDGPTGPPPVLRRPADSRSQDDNDSSRPPVLRRSGDPQPGEGGPSESAGSRPSTSGRQPAQGEDDVVKLESTLVNLPLLVSDRSGRYIPQLSARDFSLYEDGVQQTIASFGTEEVPFSVALLLDVSPSVQGNIEDIQDAAIAFVRQLRNQDRVMVVSFDRQVHYLSDFTSDRRELEWAIRKANTGSGTSVYDAVFEVVQRRLRNVDGRKAMILFSDGEDTTSSRASYDDAVNVVTESDVLVYGLRYPGTGGRGGVRVNPWPRNPIPGIQLPIPLPFPWPFPRRRRGPFRLTDMMPDGNSGGTSGSPQSWPPRNRRGGDFMADITAAGGGPVYDAERIDDLSRLANRIAEELRHVYVISYYPTNPLSNGGYRSVRVSMKGRDDIAVRHRRGYNARPNGTVKTTT